MPRFRRVQQVELKQDTFTEPARDPIPWRSDTAPMLWCHEDELEWAQTLDQKRQMVVEHRTKLDEDGEALAGSLYIVWPGAHRSDVFLVDDLLRCAEALQ